MPVDFSVVFRVEMVAFGLFSSRLFFFARAENDEASGRRTEARASKGFKCNEKETNNKSSSW